MAEIARNLRRVAEASGVSIMTASRVMRNSPLVSQETRSRVLLAARELQYCPDPIAARLMATVRKGKKTRIHAALAFIRDKREGTQDLKDYHNYVQVAAIRARAAQHGYNVDEFVLGDDGMTAKRLKSVLKARNIEGVLFSVKASRNEINGFDFSSFASVTFGYGLQTPSLHRVSTNMMHGLLAALDYLDDRGYQRIGLAISSWADNRSEHTYSGAMLHYQKSLPRTRCIAPMIFPHDELKKNRQIFAKWIKTCQADAIISFDRLIPDWIREDTGKRIPEDMGFLAHDLILEDETRYSGISHNRVHVAAAAVDLVTTQLFNGEYGVPEVARQVLIPATLVDKGSCPKVS